MLFLDEAMLISAYGRKARPAKYYRSHYRRQMASVYAYYLLGRKSRKELEMLSARRERAPLAAVAAIALFIGFPAHAAAPLAKMQEPGYYRMMLGDFEVTALSDGTVPLAVDTLLTNTSPAKVKKALDRWFLKEPVDTSVNAYLINTGTKLVLVDAGAGVLFGPTLGKLSNSLRGEKLALWGDLMHVAAVQFAEPSVTIKFDTDSKSAAVQRKRAYADAAGKGYWVAAAHLAFPGVGHVRAEGNGYAWVPANYAPLP
jgi:hypothetical protein